MQTSGLMHTNAWSTGYCNHRTMVRNGPDIGSTWPVMPIAMAMKKICPGLPRGDGAKWVIDSLNKDLPFDEFTLEQIAGDLLPNATAEQRVATGFHRNSLVNREGGIDREQLRIEQAVDRTNTVGSVWLGLTVGCAQCHDHKYDKISQKEYYQLFAFFSPAEDSEIEAPYPVKSDPI